MAAGKLNISAAIKRPGALTAKAKAAGMTVDEFAQAHRNDKGVTGDECRFYLNVLKKTDHSGAAYDAVVAKHTSK